MRLMKHILSKLITLVMLIILISGMTGIHPGLSAPLFFENPEYTHIADIIDIINYSERYDYHDTYFDPLKASEEYFNKLKLSDRNQYIILENGKRTVKIYTPSREIQDLVKQSEAAVGKSDFGRSLSLLNAARKIAPDHIGRTHYLRKDYGNSLKSADEALKLNPINFEAYKLKADVFLEKKDYGQAERNLVYAMIFNRNDMETLASLEKLGRKAGFHVYLEPFIPLYSIGKMDSGKTRIYVDTDTAVRWMPYSFCRALWKWEPGYFEKKTGEKEYRRTLYEEMEAIHCMAG
jgi:tetratricopeptide (TPR) repeat protein